MTVPRIEIDLSKIRHNTRCLVERLKRRGISVTGVTKGVCAHPAIARAMIEGGVVGLADARISNIERLRNAGFKCPISMIRTPMPSQLADVVRLCTTSFNTEFDVITGLDEMARGAGVMHNVILMVEMGDMREGILPQDLATAVRQTLKMKGIKLRGIGTNFACLGGPVPDSPTMERFSSLVDQIEKSCGVSAEIVSGGNSSNLPWALGFNPSQRTNNLRLGEAILLGVDPATGSPIGGLKTDAFTLVAEVIECGIKPEVPYRAKTTPVTSLLHLVQDNRLHVRSIIALGKQDTDTDALIMPAGVAYVGATSDHMVVQSKNLGLQVGHELRFQLNYNALMHAMAGSDITKILMDELPASPPFRGKRKGPNLALV